MSEALSVLKALGDDARLKILRVLNEREMYVELLSERLQLTPATVCFHLKKLQLAGLIDARKEQYYTIYSIRKQAFGITLSDLVLGGQDSAGQLREEMYRRKVLKAFMPHGYCEQLPVQMKKRLIVYDEIYKLFEVSRDYPEREVNEIIATIHGDFCEVRRAFVSMGWMTRSHGIYRLTGSRDSPIPEDV